MLLKVLNFFQKPSLIQLKCDAKGWVVHSLTSSPVTDVTKGKTENCLRNLRGYLSFKIKFQYIDAKSSLHHEPQLFFSFLLLKLRGIFLSYI